MSQPHVQELPVRAGYDARLRRLTNLLGFEDDLISDLNHGSLPDSVYASERLSRSGGSDGEPSPVAAEGSLDRRPRAPLRRIPRRDLCRKIAAKLGRRIRSDRHEQGRDAGLPRRSW